MTFGPDLHGLVLDRPVAYLDLSRPGASERPRRRTLFSGDASVSSGRDFKNLGRLCSECLCLKSHCFIESKPSPYRCIMGLFFHLKIWLIKADNKMVEKFQMLNYIQQSSRACASTMYLYVN